MQTLLTAIVTWLSINAGLPATNDLPRIEFVSPVEMYVVRVGAHAPGTPPAVMATSGREVRDSAMHSIEALYDDTKRTIYLPKGWTGTTPEEISVLVHEMVHHLQNVGSLQYECPQAREKPAYQAQDKWLQRVGRNIFDEFKLDPMTVLVRTTCMH